MKYLPSLEVRYFIYPSVCRYGKDFPMATSYLLSKRVARGAAFL